MKIKYNFDEIINRENTNSVKYDLRKEIFGKADIAPMWVADMDFRTPDFVREAVVKKAGDSIYGYSLTENGFKESIVYWMKKRHGWDVNQDCIVYSPGIVPALNLSVLAFSSPKNEVIIQPPVYHPFFSAVRDHGRLLKENSLILNNSNYSIDFKDLKIKAKTAEMLLFCHPHNPVGRIWNKNELEELISVCKENNTIIISDEIHSDLILARKKHIPLLTLESSSEITIACYSASKTFNLAGLSTSYLIIPNPDLRSKFQSQINRLHIGMGNFFGTVAQQAAYYKGEEWLNDLLGYLRANLKFLKKYLEKNLPVIKVIETEATYLVWMDFRSLGLTVNELDELLINEAKIGLNSGAMFGKAGEGFQRINIAVPRKVLKNALENLSKAVNKYQINL